MNWLEASLTGVIVIIVVCIYLLWLYIKSAVKAGTKEAIKEAYYELKRENKDIIHIDSEK